MPDRRKGVRIDLRSRGTSGKRSKRRKKSEYSGAVGCVHPMDSGHRVQARSPQRANREVASAPRDGGANILLSEGHQ